MHTRLLVFLFSLFFTTSLLSSEVDVYLLAGQSNMQGIGKIENLENFQGLDLQRSHYFTGKGFEPIVLGKTKTSARAGEFGPEIGFAHEMTSDGKEVYLIKYFASGMPLHAGWNGNKWIGLPATNGRTNFHPGLNAQDPNKGRLYTAMIKRFLNGLKAVGAAGHTPNIRGFLWMQGEQDSKNEISASQYAANLKRLKTRLSEDIKVNELPMVFGQVLPYSPALERFTHRKEIRSQMAAADSASGKPEAILGATMVSTDSFPLLKDKVHYNAQGQWMLGLAMARSMQNLQQIGLKTELWPNRVPGFPSDYPHKPVKQLDPERITEVSQPFMRVFPAQGTPTGQAIVLLPGGSYRILADKKEGDRIAAYFAAKGITCYTVRYRVTRGNHPSFRFPGPLLDARQAIRLAKSDALKYNFAPDKVGILGFSAGGHLAAMCATRHEDTFEIEPQSSSSVRPAFAGLIYPVASMIEKSSHAGSRTALFGKSPETKELVAASPELRVSKTTPPIFIAHNQFDVVDSSLSLNLAKACTPHKVLCELHLFPARDHGFGMGRPGQSIKENPAIVWPELFLDFLQKQL